LIREKKEFEMPDVKYLVYTDDGYVGASSLWFQSSGGACADFEMAKMGEATGEVWVVRIYQLNHIIMDPVIGVIPLERIVKVQKSSVQTEAAGDADGEFWRLL
jgi:hypothetical protein